MGLRDGLRGAGDLPVGADLIWEQARSPSRTDGREAGPGQAKGRPALFLDRDGVVNEEAGYLGDPETLRLIAGSAEVVAEANGLGVPVVIVTNQGGIGRGELTWDDFARVQRRLETLLAAHEAVPDMVVACPFHEAGRPPYRHPDHPDRKPRPGMLRRAAARLGIDLARSWIVGDSARDLRAGEAAGLAGGVLVATGHGPAERTLLSDWKPKRFDFRSRNSLSDCRDLLHDALLS